MADRNSYRTQYENQVAQLGVVEGSEELADEDRVQDEKAQKAAILRVQRLVCGYSSDVTEALDILEALGIAPAQQTPIDRHGTIPGLTLRVYSFTTSTQDTP